MNEFLAIGVGLFVLAIMSYAIINSIKSLKGLDLK